MNEVFGDVFVTIHMTDAIEADKLQVTDHVEAVELKV